MDHQTTKERITSFAFELEETDVNVSSDTPEVLLVPVQQEYYDLSYTCLFVPRFPNHQLIGDVAEFLPDWLQHICIAYGWRLEFIHIDGGHLQWALHVPPSESPAHFLQIVRTQTSKYIFENFGRIKNENPSGDFWAAGYFIRPGIYSLTDETVKQYIGFIRRQQGLFSS